LRRKRGVVFEGGAQEPLVEVLPAEDEDSVTPADLVDGSVHELLPIDIEAEDDNPTPEPSAVKRGSALVSYNPLDAYLQEIRRFAPLTREEEHEAAVAYQTTKDKDAAYKLISRNLWLVVKIARDYERVARNVLDLIQEGNMGLMDAVRNFDPYRGVRFPSYAVFWIKAYIIRYIIANWRLVKIGTTQAQRKLFFNLKKESDRLEREGIRPTPQLLADRLGVRPSDVVEMSQRMQSPDVSIDTPLREDNDTSLLSLLPSSTESAEVELARRELSSLLLSAVSEFRDRLSDKERTILEGRILDDEKSTLQELSDRLGLSKERVRQIESKLRERLRTFLLGHSGGEIEEWLEEQGYQTHELEP
jgi:RNA polymerase sigma-32 factor